jgi:TIM-barrel protein
MFSPRVALASLSGRADAGWARIGAPYAGATFLGGIAIDDATRNAARKMVERDRREFLPADPVAFVAEQFEALATAPIRAGINIRTTTISPLREVAAVCATHDAILELNAHCRQDEMCAAGAGEALLDDTDRLRNQIAAADDSGATVSVKVRAEVEGIDLPSVSHTAVAAGADIIHVDAMDSESVVEDIVAETDAFVIANNGVRNERTAGRYLAYGADAVSVGRASDNPAVLQQVCEATQTWFGTGISGQNNGGQHP